MTTFRCCQLYAWTSVVEVSFEIEKTFNIEINLKIFKINLN